MDPPLEEDAEPEPADDDAPEEVGTPPDDELPLFPPDEDDAPPLLAELEAPVPDEAPLEPPEAEEAPDAADDDDDAPLPPDELPLPPVPDVDGHAVNTPQAPASMIHFTLCISTVRVWWKDTRIVRGDSGFIPRACAWSVKPTVLATGAASRYKNVVEDGACSVNAVDERLAGAIRRTSVPAHIRSLLGHLPAGLALDADVNTAAVPLAALQLLRLSQPGGPWTLQHFNTQASATRLVVRRGLQSCALDLVALRQDLMTVVNTVLGTLFNPGELPALLERLAYHSSTLATLQTLTNHMLQATDIDRALHIMLSGVTSGQSLAFNRAALFTARPRDRFEGTLAIGPYDAAEAHHVWEAMELDDKTIEDVVAAADDPHGNSRLQRIVCSLSLVVDPRGDDEFAQVRASKQAQLFNGLPVHAVLRALDATPPFIVAELRGHEGSLGFVFADNRFSRTPVNEARLELLRFYMDQTALVWENLRLLRQVEDQARRDGLTGVYNRRAFDELLNQGLLRDARARRPSAVVMVDLDHFKQVNDRGGHAAGDMALRSLAQVMVRCLRSGDTVARYGGDEFVAYLSDVTPAELRAAVERVGREARATGISVSMGVAHAPTPTDASQLLAIADRHLYRAKELGRGCAVTADGEQVMYG